MDRSAKELDNSRYEIQSIAHAVGVLRLFLAGEKELSVTEVSKRLNLPYSSAFRFLVTLEKAGFIDRNPNSGKYQLGVFCLELGNTFLAHNDLRDIASPFLKVLRDNFGEAVHLGVLDNRARGVYLEKLEGLHPIGLMSSRVGNRFLLHCTGLGKAILANLHENKREEIIQAITLEKKTDNTISESKLFYEELKKIRKQGYAVDDEENEYGVGCVAAPIFNFVEVAGSISVSGPASRINNLVADGDLIKQIKDASENISIRLGRINNNIEIKEEMGKL